MHYSDIFRFYCCWQRIEHFLTVDSIAQIIVNCKVSDSETCQILEKVGTLAGVDAVAFQSGFDNDACSRDMWPLDGDSQPWVAAASSPGADKDIIAVAFEELSVDFLYLFRYFGVVAC